MLRFDAALGEQAQNTSGAEDAQRSAKGGRVVSIPGNGDDAGGSPEPAGEWDPGVLGRHHPDDGSPDERLDDQRVEAGGVVGRDDGRAFRGDGGRTRGDDAMADLDIGTAGRAEQAKRGGIEGLFRHGNGHGSGECRGYAATRARRVRKRMARLTPKIAKTSTSTPAQASWRWGGVPVMWL